MLISTIDKKGRLVSEIDGVLMKVNPNTDGIIVKSGKKFGQKFTNLVDKFENLFYPSYVSEKRTSESKNITTDTNNNHKSDKDNTSTNDVSEHNDSSKNNDNKIILQNGDVGKSL